MWRSLSIDHALICQRGGFISHRHNQVRDLTAGLLQKVCAHVATEPELQPLTGEQLGRSANNDDSARLDIRASSFWCNQQDAFFDVRIFHPFASSYRNRSLASIYREHERKERLEYGRRVCQVERGTFTPLVMSTGGGLAREATAFYKRLANLLSEKREESYSVTMGWLHCTLSFSLLRSSILCVCGTRRAKSFCPPDSIVEAAVSGRLPRL